MSKDSILVITLRHASDPEERGFYHAVPEEIVGFAKNNGLQSEVYDNLTDELGRKEVTWQTVIVTKGIRGEG